MDNENSHNGQEELFHTQLSSASRTDDTADAGVSRLEFLGFAATSIILAHAGQPAPPPEPRNGIPNRTLGRTREKVSLIGLGGYHLGKQVDAQESICIIRTGLDEGVHCLDNC